MCQILKKYYELCNDINKYEENVIPLCAAENYVSKFCMEPLISSFEGKYSFVDAAGDNSFIGGKYIERLNKLLSEECNTLFHANYTNADTLTGINCFTICAMSMLTSNDVALITTPEQGGHPSIPVILNTLGVKYEPIPYDFDSFQLDYSELNVLLHSQKYKHIIFCQSDVLNPPELDKINISEDMTIIYDATQTLGMIATGVIRNPLLASDNVILIGGTHKTLPAPACGLIMTNNDSYAEKLKKQITPAYLRNTQPNHIAALLLSLIEQEQQGKAYQKLVVNSANMLGHELTQLGFRVAVLNDGKYTHTHQLFLLMNEDEMKSFFQTAKQYNITLNKKEKKLFANTGIRIGTQQIARYNWGKTEITLLAKLLFHIKNKNHEEICNIRRELIAKKTPHFTYENSFIK